MTKNSPPRAWQRMLSGRRLDLLNPSPTDIDIHDIAHGLARVARWNGQTQGAHAFSVAQHVVLVEQIAIRLEPDLQPEWKLAALLHDSAEYVIGDLISPFKNAIGLDYRLFEQNLLSAVHKAFQIPTHPPQEIVTLIKTSDRIAAYCEATQLAGFNTQEAHDLFGPMPLQAGTFITHVTPLTPWATDVAQQQFLTRFRELEKELSETP